MILAGGGGMLCVRRGSAPGVRPGGVPGDPRTDASPSGGAADEWMASMESFEQLKRLVAEAEEDIRKAEGGNKAAGTRARSTMQEIKQAAQDVRQKILELRDGGSAG